MGSEDASSHYYLWALVTVVVITEHRKKKTFFLIHLNDVLCFASVPWTEMEEGWIVGNIRQGNHHSSFFFFFKSNTQRKTRMTKGNWKY